LEAVRATGFTAGSDSNNLEGLEHPETLAPGESMAVFQQPFLDYWLAVGEAREEGAEGREPSPPTWDDNDRLSTRGDPGHRARTFQVFVPGDLLTHSCKPQWLPTHPHALSETLLCPLVVVASRLGQSDMSESFPGGVGAGEKGEGDRGGTPAGGGTGGGGRCTWPSLLVDIRPGFSVRNHLPLPLGLRLSFSQPMLSLRQASRGSLRGSGGEGSGSIGTGTRDVGRPDLGAASDAPRTPEDLVVYQTEVPRECSRSFWQLQDVRGFPMPVVLPKVICEIGLREEGAEEGG
ncbi:unnamed protein product, partial [Discosporangium mesarthrocarpum]